MIKTVNLAHANKYKWTEGIKDVLCPTYRFFFFFFGLISLMGISFNHEE